MAFIGLAIGLIWRALYNGACVLSLSCYCDLALWACVLVSMCYDLVLCRSVGGCPCPVLWAACLVCCAAIGVYSIDSGGGWYQ